MDVPGNHTERFVGEELQLGRFLKDLERRAAEEQLTDPETEALIDLRISSQLRMSEKQPKFVFEDLDDETRAALLALANQRAHAIDWDEQTAVHAEIVAKREESWKTFAVELARRETRSAELWRKVTTSESTARPEQLGFSSSRSDRQTSPDPERHGQPGLRSSRSDRQTSPDPDGLTDPRSTARADLSGNHSTILRSTLAAIPGQVQTRQQVLKEG